MLRLKNVSKSFGEIKALKNISLSIDKGEFAFITGPSGSGKTTLLKLILRELRPDSGEIIFEGENLSLLPKSKIPKIRQRIGVVFQDFKLISERTVRENIEVALAVLGLPQKEWKVRVNHVLKLVGIYDRSELFPSQLSGGEMQRASLARALAVNPKLILADEPTGNLDWKTASEIVDLFDRINKEGKTILMATHNKMIVDKLRKRVIELSQGELKKVNLKKDNSD